ncbi:MAG TPA: S41 family peptidase [Kiritimatiellia bacterium]|nr:S41 family peptidase [Kiritimatiellia bacterium]HMP00133.1 S41 family peptidase [Kiritimatiellia bacterium]HMP96655.1 S41 family peptidase [Kiritimatiellia bacterium]
MNRLRCQARACLIALLLASSCGKRAEPIPASPELARELHLLQTALNTLQERYVDEDQVHMERLVERGLRGMLESLDPFAELIPHHEAVAIEPVPPDAPAVEVRAIGEEPLVAVRVFQFTAEMRRALRGPETTIRALAPEGILLDVRGALGDDYPAAAALAEWFLPANTSLGTLLEKGGEPPRVMFTRRSPLELDTRLVVLIDRETRGPGEWLAAALHVHGRAILVGEPSRGATVIQTTMRLTEDWSVRLTTGRARDPDGRELTGTPLMPDIQAQPPADTKENVDWIYHRGLRVLREMATDAGWKLPVDP